MKEELQKNKKGGDDHRKDEVIITVDGVEKKIHLGSVTGVPEADKLAILVDGQLKTLKVSNELKEAGKAS